jgi:hypothetical protein
VWAVMVCGDDGFVDFLCLGADFALLSLIKSLRLVLMQLGIVSHTSFLIGCLSVVVILYPYLKSLRI